MQTSLCAAAARVKAATRRRGDRAGDTCPRIETSRAETASSEPEFTAWLLYFGAEARLLKPDCLVKDINRIIMGLKRQYRNKGQ
jgi:hypothetical protein